MISRFRNLAGKGASLLDVYFGVDPDSETASRMRAAQMAAILKTAFMMNVSKILISTCVFIVFYDHPAAWFLPYWLFLMYYVGATGIYHAWLKQQKGKILTASKAAYTKAVKSAIITGGLWISMAIALYPNLSSDERGILIAVLSGMMGGGAMSLYYIPRALFVWVFIFVIGSSIALLIDPTKGNIAVIAMLMVYSAALCKAGHTMAKNFASNVLDGFEISEQSETIGLLLKDFSENASDWLWELDSQGNLVRGKDEFVEKLKFNFLCTNLLNMPDGPLVDNGQVLNMRALKELSEKFEKHESFRDLIINSKGERGNSWINYPKGKLTGFRGVASDITDAKNAEERIAYLAHNDALTGLVNRESFSLELENLLKNDDDQRWSVFYLDLDGFKGVNDTYGHSMGDQLLGMVSVMLKRSVESNDIVARLGGDEFAILAKTCPTVQSASAMAETILGSFSKPMVIDGVVLDIGVSIGITLSHRDGLDANTLMNNADIALYRAKADGKGCYRLYKREMDEIVKERRSLEVDLKNALRYGQLTLHFQPLISAKTGKTVSFEVLARWHHPQRGAISPSDFIPIAERMGIIAEIGDWVIQRACEVAAEIPEDISIAVNLSPQQFKSNRIIKTVVDALKESGLNPRRLELEITEGLFMENTKEVMFALRELKSMGISIALDDFGTGYSSLSYLLKFPFDKLKIDRSLIASLEERDNAYNVLEAITKLASEMGLEITAEGVETLEQVVLLRHLDCTHFQGYLFGKPLTFEELSSFLLNEFTRFEKLIDIKATA